MRWSAGATVGILVASLAALTGSKNEVALRPRGFWRRLLTRTNCIDTSTPLERVAAIHVEAFAKVRKEREPQTEGTEIAAGRLPQLLPEDL